MVFEALFISGDKQVTEIIAHYIFNGSYKYTVYKLEYLIYWMSVKVKNMEIVITM